MPRDVAPHVQSRKVVYISRCFRKGGGEALGFLATSSWLSASSTSPIKHTALQLLKCTMQVFVILLDVSTEESGLLAGLLSLQPQL